MSKDLAKTAKIHAEIAKNIFNLCGLSASLHALRERIKYLDKRYAL